MRGAFYFFTVFCYSMLLSGDGAAQSKRNKLKPSANFSIQQLAPGVWVAIHNDHYGKAICNAGIIDMGDKTLVLDPFMNPNVAFELNETAKKLTGREVSIVINSHYHNDHIRGNQAFPKATIISTSTTRKLIVQNEPAEQEWEKTHAPTLLQALRKRMANSSSIDRDELPYWIGYYEGLVESSENLQLTLPDQTFDDSLWIEGKKLTVKIVECRDSHTPSDAVVLIPALGIAFMGDLLCTDRHPWLSDGDLKGWQESLRTFYEDTVYHTFLPGHGRVCEKPALKTLYQYLSDIQSLCDAATTDSAQSVLMNNPIPYPYNSWFCGRFYQPNLQHLINLSKEQQSSSHSQ